MRIFLKTLSSLLVVAIVCAIGCTKPNNDDNGNGNNNNENPGGGTSGSDVVVTTFLPSDIKTSSAVCGGSVEVIQGLSLTKVGVCWSTSPNPTANDSQLSSEAWNEPFTRMITGLSPNTTYHVRAFALRGLEYYYGEDMSFTTINVTSWPDGLLPGTFSVSAVKKVRFSQGNLQYCASSNIWRFAETQWDYVGSQNPSYGNAGGTVAGSDNANLSQTYHGWIDLFGWGTSGYNHGAICYQPWSISKEDSDYFAYGQYDSNLYDQSGQADWGYNAISNGGNRENCWRTLTTEEWMHLLHNRNTSSNMRYAKAIVAGVNGLIILPDNWNSSIHDLACVNQEGINYDNNVLSVSEWNILEQQGVVFLPAAGDRFAGVSVEDTGSRGYYWSATSYTFQHYYEAYCMVIYDGNVFGDLHDGWAFRTMGFSVRLVQDF